MMPPSIICKIKLPVPGSMYNKFMERFLNNYSDENKNSHNPENIYPLIEKILLMMIRFVF